MPKVVVKETSPVWIKSGNKDALDLAKERMEEILATHKLEPLTPAQEQIIENVLKEPREYYRKNGLILRRGMDCLLGKLWSQLISSKAGLPGAI